MSKGVVKIYFWVLEGCSRGRGRGDEVLFISQMMLGLYT
jgi:hypothetical protein